MYFSPSAAQLAIDFVQELKLTKSTKSNRPEPFLLLPFHKRLIANLFGWKQDDGSRLYRRGYFSVARKNAKTQIAAAIGLILLFADDEMSPEIYAAAKDRDQASACFDAARDMVYADDDLRSIAIVTDSKKQIANTLNNGIFRALSSDGGSKHGKNPSAVIIDELHAWKAREEELYNALTTGSGARKQPLELIITTAGFDKASLCYRQYEYAKKVQSGLVEDSNFLPQIYEIPDDKDWRDEANWPLSNPGIDQIVSRKYLRDEAQKAISVPGEENKWRRLFGNQWTSQESRVIPMDRWEACEPPPPDEELIGEICYAGLDLSGGGGDVTAFVLVFPRPDNRYVVKPYFWLPETALTRQNNKETVPYELWNREKLITLTPGTTVDYSIVRKCINELGQRYRIMEIAADKSMAAQMLQDLDRDGFEMISFGQGFGWFSMPFKELINAVMDGRLQHGNHPVMNFMADCVTALSDVDERIRPVKPARFKSGKRIDGIVAAIMGFDRALRNEDSTSIYETQGIRYL